MNKGITLVARKRKHVSAFEIATLVVLSVFSIILLALFAWGFISSFRDHYGVIDEPFKIFSGLSFDNYKIIFGNDFVFKTGKFGYTLLDLFANSFIYSVGGALAQTFCTAVVHQTNGIPLHPYQARYRHKYKPHDNEPHQQQKPICVLAALQSKMKNRSHSHDLNSTIQIHSQATSVSMNPCISALIPEKDHLKTTNNE